MPTIYSSHKGLDTNKSTPSSRKKPSSVVTPLTSFVVNPTGIRFETQQEDERVVIFMRQHLIVNFGWVLLVLLMIFAPTAIFPFFLTILKPPQITVPINYIVIATLFWYVATFGFTIASFIRWFFNIYIVTNERIVDVDFIHLLYKELSEAQLSNVQDVTYKSGGLLETMFNYGNVYVQTAGTEPNFEFLSIPNPEIVVQTISEQVEKEKLRFK